MTALLPRLFKVPVSLILDYGLIARNTVRQVLDHHPPEQWKIGKKGTVLLVPGLHETWIPLQKVGNLCNEHGYQVTWLTEFGTIVKPVSELVKMCKRFVLGSCQQDLIIISHSKGGIVARYLLLDEHINRKISKIITIATPHFGSYGAFILPSARELAPNSLIITTLNEATLEKKDLLQKITNFYPTFDNHVIPNASLQLPGALNYQVNVMGHTRIINSPQLLALISKTITQD